MPSPGEQPRSPSVRWRRVMLGVLASVAVGAWLLMFNRHLQEYRLYFTEDRKPAQFEFKDLSEDWSEQTLTTRFNGLPVSCHPYRGEPGVDRACALYVQSLNGVPTLFVSFFFSANRLHQMSVNIPWWSLGKAHDSLSKQLGAPAASQFRPRDGVRLQGWRLPNGAALFVNRDRPANPLEWNAIYWRSPTACAQGACFTTAKP